ncbi:Uncharacterised protein [Enterobacter kobei]|uniref:ead/Ea22-like family protein n=1 Tax=Enterobacter kobei TaxID=208224 RepID=UPI0012590480|nr:Uncharacterised protein [Enterobacter kobei]
MSNIDKRALRDSAESTIGILENISRFEPSDIDGDTVELRFETEDGFDTGCDVSIVDQCQKAADVVRALLDELEAVQKTSAARLGAIDTTHKMFQRERGRADAAERRVAELEAREVRLTDINEYLAKVHDKTLNRAFRLLAEGVRAGDVAAMRAAGINVAAAGKGE